jgi:hypothetical protein
MANDQQALEAVPFAARATRVRRRHQALQRPFGLLSALPRLAGTLACLAEFRRIYPVKPHPFLADRQAVTIGRMEPAGVSDLGPVVQFGGN